MHVLSHRWDIEQVNSGWDKMLSERVLHGGAGRVVWRTAAVEGREGVCPVVALELS